LIFVTVGTLGPFDRLVRAVDELCGRGAIHEQVFAQAGKTSYHARHIQVVESLSRDAFDERMRRSSAVIGHAGMGTILKAIAIEKPLLVVPREKRFAEHVNDHQVATARRFAELQHVLACFDVRDLVTQIGLLHGFRPAPRVPRSAQVSRRIREFLEQSVSR